MLNHILNVAGPVKIPKKPINKKKPSQSPPHCHYVPPKLQEHPAPTPEPESERISKWTGKSIDHTRAHFVPRTHYKERSYIFNSHGTCCTWLAKYNKEDSLINGLSLWTKKENDDGRWEIVRAINPRSYCKALKKRKFGPYKKQTAQKKARQYNKEDLEKNKGIKVWTIKQNEDTDTYNIIKI